jgi:hypothetical protein
MAGTTKVAATANNKWASDMLENSTNILQALVKFDQRP